MYSKPSANKTNLLQSRIIIIIIALIQQHFTSKEEKLQAAQADDAITGNVTHALRPPGQGGVVLQRFEF